MNLKFDESVAVQYKNLSQKVRVMSESWLVDNVFCPCCGNEHIGKLHNNLPVADMRCTNCGEIFELKSKRNSIGAKIVDGAYHTMIERINSNINPELFVLKYTDNFSVEDLIFIPKFFFTTDIIEKRKPLSSNAKRAGWVGCNILYEKIPEQCKINVIKNGSEAKVENVLKQYQKIKNLQVNNLKVRGWMLDILSCINNMKSETFTLQEIYKYVDHLREKHTNNHNIEAKIRQQLQFLRDKGFIEFNGCGHYKIIEKYF